MRNILILYIIFSSTTLISQISINKNAINVSIDNGITLLLSNKEPNPTTILALRYINDNFLEKNDSITKYIKQHINKVQSNDEVISFMRLIMSGNFFIEKKRSLFDRLTLNAMYCDMLPVSDDFINKLDYYSDSGDIYMITHCALALQFLHENNCFSFDNKEYKELHTKLSNKMSEFLDSTEFVLDPYVESVMMLFYIGSGNYVCENYIQKIINVQLPDGGWSKYKSENYCISNDHTTVLAIWALCAYRNKGVAKINWIVK